MSDTHEHMFTEGWIRGWETFRACRCGVYDNPNVLESDFPDYPVNPLIGLTGND